MIEDKIWSDNPEQFIIGADEVGRGSFAGPICASAVRVNYHQMQSFQHVKDSISNLDGSNFFVLLSIALISATIYAFVMVCENRL